MKIKELQEGKGYLEEGPAWDALKKAGTAVGKGIGAAGQIAGAGVGAVAGAGDAFKQGYRSARATVAGGPSSGSAPAAAPAPATAPAPTGAEPATAPTATSPAAAPAAGTPPAAALAAGTPPATTPKQPGVLGKIGNAIKGALGSKPAAPAAEPATAPAGPDAAAQARIAAAPHGYNPETGQPNPAPDAAPAPSAPGKNAAATDPYEKLKGDVRKIQVVPGGKTLPAEMAAKLDGDMAKLAKGDKDSGAFAAQKILAFAKAGYDVSALQPKWMASSKAGERFLTQSVYREITKMLKEHGLTWANLGLRVRLNESVKGHGVFLSKRIATPVMKSTNTVEETLKSKFKGM